MLKINLKQGVFNIIVCYEILKEQSEKHNLVFMTTVNLLFLLAS